MKIFIYFLYSELKSKAKLMLFLCFAEKISIITK
nr:MAG TPA: hypothetical protein [Inoviridae sp.]